MENGRRFSTHSYQIAALHFPSSPFNIIFLSSYAPTRARTHAVKRTSLSALEKEAERPIFIPWKFRMMST